MVKKIIQEDIPNFGIYIIDLLIFNYILAGRCWSKVPNPSCNIKLLKRLKFEWYTLHHGIFGVFWNVKILVP
jgi:hypothetical protein